MSLVPSPFKTPSEVAAILRVHRSNVYRLIETGKLKAVRVGNQWRIHEDALSEFTNSESHTAEVAS